MTSKLIFDNIHQYIHISPIAKMIIDSVPFQRMRHIQQLGVASYVFPSAKHTRFEHSIGVYYLAGRLLENIKKNSTDLELSDRTIELVKIGGLCHDIGHGIYSHVFDNLILNDVDDTNENKTHEIRSCKLVEYIINKYVNNINMFIEPSEIKFIQDIINPSKNNTGYIYQIVSNNLNGIDVDKFDYIIRDSYNIGIKNNFDCSRILDEVKVIDDKICYPKQTYFHLCNLFTTRYYLHKQIYTHKTIIAIEYMIYDIIKLLEPHLGLTESINDFDEFVKYTDEYIINYLNFVNNNNENIFLARNILKRIQTRQLYKFIGEYTITKKI
jgi:HD superfamily phosphohydrolase